MGRLRKEVLLEWFENRAGLRHWRARLLDEPIPARTGWLSTLGSALLFLFLLQAVTGVALMFYYAPTPDHAYESLRYLETELLWGKLLRGVHHWAASFFVVVAALHMLRVFMQGSFKPPRELNWMTGVILLILAGGLAFTGYLLPWDQKAYWATVVGINMARLAPMGESIRRIVQGGEELGALTLSRFFTVHVMLLPAATALVIGTHLYLLRKHGAAGPVVPGEGKKPFYPGQAARDLTVAACVLIAIIILARLAGVPNDAKADPTDTNFIPRPEWYFLFLFELLKFFPGRLEVIGAIIVPAVVLLAMFAVPIFDRTAARHPRQRKLAVTIGLALVASILLLTVKGLGELPVQSNAAERRGAGDWTPAEIRGNILYEKKGCARCHAGGGVGVDLRRPSGIRDGEWISWHVADPEFIAPGDREPTETMTDEDRWALVAYCLRLGTGSETRVGIPDVVRNGALLYFRENCSTCHRWRGQGGTTGPDLTRVRERRDSRWIVEHFKNPKQLSPGTKMPPFDYLSEAELADLTTFLLEGSHERK